MSCFCVEFCKIGFLVKLIYDLINAKMDEKVVSPATKKKDVCVQGFILTAGFKVSVRCEDVR